MSRGTELEKIQPCLGNPIGGVCVCVCVCAHARVCVQELGRRGEARRQLARGLGARPQPQPWRSAKERVIRGTH